MCIRNNSSSPNIFKLCDIFKTYRIYSLHKLNHVWMSARKCIPQFPIESLQCIVGSVNQNECSIHSVSVNNCMNIPRMWTVLLQPSIAKIFPEGIELCDFPVSSKVAQINGIPNLSISSIGITVRSSINPPGFIKSWTTSIGMLNFINFLRIACLK